MTLGRFAADTDTGQRRRGNEDAYVCDPPLFAVADGMGGAQAGEIASHLAATSLQRSGPAGPSAEQRVSDLIQEANRSVYERARTDESASGMGTTMTVALVDGDVVRIGHVGDSRAYLVRDHVLEQLTEDHSLVAELVRSGRLSPEEAEAHPQRSVITRVLGTDPVVDVDAFSVVARPGDLFMLSTDGLSSMVDAERILSVLEDRRSDLRAAARALIEEANNAGGEDNITVVLFEMASLDDTAELPAAAVEPITELPSEDTLTGIAVPASVAQPRAARPATTRRRRFSWRIAAPLAVVFVAVIAGLSVFGVSRAYFVGANGSGHLVVYQGVPWDLPFGIRLYRTVYVSRVLAAQLSRPERERLFDHSLVARSSAEAKVKGYEQDVIEP